MLSEQKNLLIEQKKFMIRRHKRLNIFLHVLLCWVCQIVLVASIAELLFSDPKYRTSFTTEVGVSILFGRFICATILHLSLIDEVSRGVISLKYVVNHPYKFHNVNIACLVCFLQAVSVLAIEMVNVLIILTSDTPTELVYNFIALAIIAEFDNFVYQSLKSESLKKLCSHEISQQILIIKHTTSKKCKDFELSDVLDEETKEFRKLRVTFKDRDCGNKCWYAVYKVLKSFYVSLYFYFLPFSAILLSCLIPIVQQIFSNFCFGWDC